MNKNNTQYLIQKVSENTDIDKKICKQVIDWLLEQIEYEVIQWKRLSLTWYFNIEAKWMQWQVMYNTKFKQKMKVNAYRYVSMIPARRFKEVIKIHDMNNKKD